MADELREPAAPFHTHEVANQVPPLAGRNLFADKLPLVEALEREGAGWALGRAHDVGAAWARSRSAGASRPTSTRRS